MYVLLVYIHIVEWCTLHTTSNCPTELRRRIGPHCLQFSGHHRFTATVGQSWSSFSIQCEDKQRFAFSFLFMPFVMWLIFLSFLNVFFFPLLYFTVYNFSSCVPPLILHYISFPGLVFLFSYSLFLIFFIAYCSFIFLPFFLRWSEVTYF